METAYGVDSACTIINCFYLNILPSNLLPLFSAALPLECLSSLFLLALPLPVFESQLQYPLDLVYEQTSY